MTRTSQNKVAVVTGGANGLGLAVSKRFAEEGFNVCILDINLAAAERETAKLKERGVQALCIQTDISNPDSVEQSFSHCVANFARIDILVCCAAVSSVEPFLDVTPSSWDATFAVNTRGLFFCNQKAGSIMRKTGGGRIINITSPASYMGLPFYTAYAASKAAVDSITRSAAIALAPYNIRVNSLAPGRMDTDMQRASEKSWAKLTGMEYEAFVESRT
jgi:3-oxoacyl-[acyl-carrier protein] reductase